MKRRSVRPCAACRGGRCPACRGTRLQPVTGPCPVCGGGGACGACGGVPVQGRRPQPCGVCDGRGQRRRQCDCELGVGSSTTPPPPHTIGRRFQPRVNLLDRFAADEGGRWHGFVEDADVRWPQDVPELYLMAGLLRAAGRDAYGAFELAGAAPPEGGGVVNLEKKYYKHPALTSKVQIWHGRLTVQDGVRVLAGTTQPAGQPEAVPGRFWLCNAAACQVRGPGCTNLAQYGTAESGLACPTCARCDACDGSGLRSDESCGDCGGTGQAVVDILCEACEGQGRCRGCRGAKRVPQEVSCQPCRGQGKCPDCSGYAVNDVWKPEECTDCAGSGSDEPLKASMQASLRRILEESPLAFAWNHRVSHDSLATLDAVLEVLRRGPRLPVQLQVWTDSVGPKATEVAEQRAAHVRHYLTQKGPFKAKRFPVAVQEGCRVRDFRLTVLSAAEDSAAGPAEGAPRPGPKGPFQPGLRDYVLRCIGEPPAASG
eukprot:EG_transcript_8172